jgi:hypothetical protein
MGNVLIGLEDSLTSQLACTTAGLCANYGFYLNSWTMPGAGPVRIEDNVVIGLSAKFEGAAVYVPQPSPPAFDIEVRHLTFDNRGRHLLACKRAVRDAVDQYATPAPYRLEVTDLAAMNLDGCAVFDCSVCDSGLDDSLENAYLRRTLVTSEDVGPADGIDLVDAQYFMVDLGFVDPAHGNYNLSPSSPLFSGGRYPPGDPVGARAFRFDRARLQERWGGALPFPGEQPADIANVPNDDTDADGVIDLHDDCPAIADPGQPDSDGDGAGDACDRCPTTADPEQADSDADGLGDACDPCPYDAGPDPDGDGVCNRFDNCATVANPDQVDTDLDGSGDACDNCPVRFNRRQGDADGDGIGDVCEPGPSVTRTEPHGTNPRQSVQERMRPH